MAYPIDMSERKWYHTPYMKQDYKDITSILEDFCSSYKDLKELSNDLTKALRGTIQTISEDASTEIAIRVTSENDRKYVNTLASAIKSRDPLSALHIYASCIDELCGVIDARKATVAKLQERITLQDEDSPEVKVAIKKRAQYNSEIDVLKERVEFCMTRFYCLRQSVIKRIIQYSRRIAASLEDDLVAIARPIASKFRMPPVSPETIDGKIAEVNR